MGWKPDDFDKFTIRDLMTAFRGYRKGRDEEWEMIRYGIFWPVKLNSQKRFSFSDIKLPYDSYKEMDKEHIPASFKKLTKEEVAERYRKSGFSLSDRKLNEIMA